MTSDPRRAAVDVVSAVTDGGAYIDEALDRSCPKDRFSERDRALAARISFGTVKRLLELDAVIAHYSDTPLRKLDRDIRNILRISFYQLIYMTKVPGYAVANEAVRLSGRVRGGRYKGFVNALIRSFLREESEYEPFSDKLSVRYSMPDMIVDMWLSRFGREETERLLAEFLKPRRISLRVNTVKTTTDELILLMRKEGIRVDVCEDTPDALVLTERVRPDSLPGYHEGLFYVMDISSMKPPLYAGIKAGDRVLDVCSAPGGKSLIAAMLCGSDGSVTARDKSTDRLLSVEDNIKRLGIENITTEVWDATLANPEDEGAFDVVLADLPCSGLGVLKHKPESKYRITEADMAALSALQHDILSVAARAVKPQGTLVFSTCTINSMENEDNTARLLKEHDGFTLISEEQVLPDELHDGFYVAVMRKTRDE